MILRVLAVSSLLLPVPFAMADGDFSRTLTVSAQPDLFVSAASGNIRITPGDGGRIEIRAHLHISGFGGSGDAQERINRIVANPPITQSGNTIRVGDLEDRDLQRNISIDYQIKVPASVALNLRSGSGDLQVDGVGRYLAADTGSGSVRAHGLRGGAQLHTGSGDIELNEAASGDVSAKTGSGSVRIRGLNGGLTATSGSGDIEADGHLSNPTRLSTGSGSVRLRLSRDSHFDLGASTGSGEIRVNFPGAPAQDEHSRHHLTGPVNGGGPALDVRTGSGDVEVSAA